MLNPYDVFLIKNDGLYLWIGDADSLQSAWKLIEAKKSSPEDKFKVYDRNSSETIEVRAGQLATKLGG